MTTFRRDLLQTLAVGLCLGGFSFSGIRVDRSFEV